jgi:hypothetical protein
MAHNVQQAMNIHHFEQLMRIFHEEQDNGGFDIDKVWEYLES